MKTDPNESAFCNGYEDPGLTKREHFAGLAMQGLVAGDDGTSTAECFASDAVKIADYLIAELNKPEAGK